VNSRGLALVRVTPEGPNRDEVCYLTDPFKGFDFGDFAPTACGATGRPRGPEAARRRDVT